MSDRRQIVTVRLNRAEKQGLSSLARLYGKSMEEIMRILLGQAMLSDQRALEEIADRDRERERVRG